MSLLSFIKKISFVLAIYLIISPVFFLQSKILFAQATNKLDDQNTKPKDENTPNIITSFFNRLSVSVYCGISNIFVNSCDLQVTRIDTSKNTTNVIFNRNENRTTVTHTTNGDFFTERFNELAAILRQELLSTVTTVTGPQGPKGDRGPSGRGGSGRDGQDGADGEDAFLAIGSLGYILQSTGTTTEWVATSTLGITGDGETFSTSSARASLSESITGIDYDSTSGDFSLTSGYLIPTTASSTNWNTAYSWGNHATAGYLTSYTETDPIFTAASSTFTFKANNLSDLTSSSTARTNLGLGSLSLLNTINNSNWSGTALAISNGGTGTTTTPTLGQLLMGNNTGGYDLVATSSLGIQDTRLVNYIPYTGATSAVDLGSQTLVSTGAATFGVNGDAYAILGNTGNNAGYFEGPGQSITLADGTYAINAIGNMAVDGNVGIGTTTLNSKLTIAGDIDFTGALKSNGDAGTTGYILQTTGTGVQWVATSSLGISGGGVGTSTQWITDGSNISYSIGNVGIGTTTPNFGLTVASNGYFGSNLSTAGILSVLSTGTSTFAGNISIAGNIVPTVDNTQSLGTLDKQWRDVFIGPGSLYVNGQKVLEEDGSNNIIVSADINQSLIIKTLGTGDIEFNPSGTGLIYMKGNVQVSGGKTFTTTDSSALSFVSGVLAGNLQTAGNTISATNLNGGISLSPIGNGGVYVTSGNLGVGTTTPNSKLTVAGDIDFTGALKVNGSTGTTGYILQTTGTGAQWVATSTLGFGSLSLLNTINNSNWSGTALAISNGGTGTTTTPTLGQLLMGNNTGGYDLVATSSLGISGGTSQDLNALTAIVVGFENATTTLGTNASVFGYQNTAASSSNSVFGYKNIASTPNSVLLGNQNFTSTNGLTSVSVGILNNSGGATIDTSTGVITGTASATTTVGVGSTAVGVLNTARGKKTVAMGYSNLAGGTGSTNGAVAIGIENSATANSAVAMGMNNTASSYSTTAVGSGNIASGNSGSTAIGANNTASRNRNSAVGYGNTASGTTSGASAFGNSNTSSGTNSLSVGAYNTASAVYTSASGYSNTAASSSAQAFGYKNIASTRNSVLLGNQNFTSTNGLTSVSVGILNNSGGATINVSTGAITGTAVATTTVGKLSTAIGIQNIAQGDRSLAFGYQNIAESADSMSFGSLNINSDIFTSAFGIGNAVSAVRSSSFGYQNISSGGESSAFGYENEALGIYSSAFGYKNITASSSASAFGYQNIASATNASAFGSSITNSIASSTMIGPSDTAKITILSSGNVGIGTTTPGVALSVIGNAQFTAIDSGTFSQDINITADGTLTTSASDIRLKQNIQLLNASSTLEKLLLLEPSSFEWKDTGTHDIGLIAQSVEKIFPELVFTNKTDGYKGINYSRLPALLISGVQELAYKIAQLTHLVKTERVETETLCVGQTCVTEDQLKSLLEYQGTPSVSIPSSSTPPDPIIIDETPIGDQTGETTTPPSTPDTPPVVEPPVIPPEPLVVEDPIVENSITPDPAPESSPEQSSSPVI